MQKQSLIFNGRDVKPPIFLLSLVDITVRVPFLYLHKEWKVEALSPSISESYFYFEKVTNLLTY